MQRPATRWLPFLTLAALALVGPLAPGARAQDAAPYDRVLFSAVLQGLPEPPAFIRLVRIVLEPGASVPLHSHDGPEFAYVEQGTLAVEVGGDVVIAQAGGETPGQPRVPPQNEPFPMAQGDQIVYPAGVPLTFRNDGPVPVRLLTLVVFPIVEGRVSAATWVNGTPEPTANEGVTSELLGDAIAPGWPGGPLLVRLERLVLPPGQAIPAQVGPTLLSVELGQFGFSLVDGQYQVWRGPDGFRENATPGAAEILGPRQAVFFPAGMSELPRSPGDGELVLLRLSIQGTSVATPTAAETPAPTTAAPAQATAAPTEPAQAPTSAPEPTAPPAGDGFPPDTEVVVTQSGVRLRANPSTEAEVVAGLEEGVRLVVTGPPVDAEGFTWYPVRAADDPAIAGFVAVDFLALPPAG